MLTSGACLFTANGRVRFVQGAPVVTVGATPIAADGRLATGINAPVMYTQGMGFRGDGSLACADINTGVAFLSQGIAFNSTGQVLLDQVAPIAAYCGGVPLTPAGAIAVFQG